MQPKEAEPEPAPAAAAAAPAPADHAPPPQAAAGLRAMSRGLLPYAPPPPPPGSDSAPQAPVSPRPLALPSFAPPLLMDSLPDHPPAAPAAAPSAHAAAPAQTLPRYVVAAALVFRSHGCQRAPHRRAGGVRRAAPAPGGRCAVCPRPARPPPGPCVPAGQPAGHRGCVRNRRAAPAVSHYPAGKTTLARAVAAALRDVFGGSHVELALGGMSAQPLEPEAARQALLAKLGDSSAAGGLDRAYLVRPRRGSCDGSAAGLTPA